MKILIFGAGGVGSVVGGFLARTGHEVSLLGRPWHLDVIRKNGLSISGIWGDYRIKAFDLYTTADEIRLSGASFDLIILTVKAYDTREAVAQLVPLMGPDTMLLSLQNGLGNVEAVLEKVKPENFLAGRLIFGVDTLPGAAKVTVTAEPVYIGKIEGSSPKLTPDRLAVTMTNAKIPTEAVADILPYIWSKAIYNCALNPICTLHEMPYGKILENSETRARMEAVVRECYAVGLKQGVKLVPATADGFLERLTGTLIPRTAAHYPSMLQDKRRGRRTEIDSLNGAIARLGAALGVPAPVNVELAKALA